MWSALVHNMNLKGVVVSNEDDFEPLTREQLLAIINYEMDQNGRFADTLFQWLDSMGIVAPYELGEKPIPPLVVS